MEPSSEPRPKTLAHSHRILVEPSRNPAEPYLRAAQILHGTLEKPSGTVCQGRSGPPRSLSGLRPQSFSCWGKTSLFKLPPRPSAPRRHWWRRHLGCLGCVQAQHAHGPPGRTQVSKRRLARSPRSHKENGEFPLQLADGWCGLVVARCEFLSYSKTPPIERAWSNGRGSLHFGIWAFFLVESCQRQRYSLCPSFGPNKCIRIWQRLPGGGLS